MREPISLAIEAREVRKTFPHAGLGRLEVIAGVTLAVRGGTPVALLGPSGCGKSTFLKILAGLIPPTAGSVTVFGQSDPSRFNDKCAIMFQDPCLLPWRDVVRNIVLPLEIKNKRPNPPDQVDAIVDMVGLTGFERSRPRELSGGMKLRAALARTLIDEVPLLLLDEPFGALDEVTRWRLNEELNHLCRKLGRTLVVVTHSVEEACYLGQEIYVLSPRPMAIRRAFTSSLDRGADRRVLDSRDGRELVVQVREALYEA